MENQSFIVFTSHLKTLALNNLYAVMSRLAHPDPRG
uniref:Uncharacterized protein n=1 Tax=Arundo donax TaxID=35708 RepID=A0A0A8ZHQ4_ARUDO